MRKTQHLLLIMASAGMLLAGCGSSKKKSGHKLVVFSNLEESADSSALKLDSEELIQRGSKHPVIDGIKIRVRGVDLCTGYSVVGAGNVCSSQVVFFEDQKEIVLSGSESVEVDLSDGIYAEEVAAAEYFSARLTFSREYAIKAKFYEEEEDKTYFTASSGIESVEGDVENPEAWDYLEIPEIHSGASELVQESNQFHKSFTYDGESDLTVRVIMDVKRAGKFYADEDGWRWGLSNFNTYVMFNQEKPAKVETYLLAASLEGLSSSSHVLNLVFDEDDNFFGGMGQGSEAFGDSGTTVYPFLRNFVCEGSDNKSDCSFESGAPEVAPSGSTNTYEDGFVQTATGFQRLEIGETGTCQMTGTNVPETLYFKRIAR